MENLINQPLQFFAEDPGNVHLIFEIFRNSSSNDKGTQIIGTAIALLKRLRQGPAPHRESLIRDFTVPILENGSMTYIGFVKFSILVVTPFRHLNTPMKVSPGFWKDGSTQVIRDIEDLVQTPPRVQIFRLERIQSSHSSRHPAWVRPVLYSMCS